MLRHSQPIDVDSRVMHVAPVTSSHTWRRPFRPPMLQRTLSGTFERSFCWCQVDEQSLPGHTLTHAHHMAYRRLCLTESIGPTRRGVIIKQSTGRMSTSHWCLQRMIKVRTDKRSEVSTRSKSRPQRVQKTVNDKRPHANMLRIQNTRTHVRRMRTLG